MSLARSLRRLTLSTSVLIAAAGCTDLPTAATDATESPIGSFSSLLTPGGSASRTYVMETPGTLSVRLASTTPDGVLLGLGIGIPKSSGAGCSLNFTVQTAAGPTPQVSAATAAGVYCVQLYDLGTLTEPMAFTLSLSRQ